MNLKKMKVTELVTHESIAINGGNGVHACGYTTARDMDIMGAYMVGAVVGCVKGLYRRWFS